MTTTVAYCIVLYDYEEATTTFIMVIMTTATTFMGASEKDYPLQLGRY